MYYFAHLIFPALVAIVVVAAGDVEISFAWLERASSSFGSMYMLFAMPHFVWASATSYFEASKATTVGGFVGAHLLLGAVAILVATSSSREAANGWFLYLFGSPVTILLGAFVARKVHQWQAKTAA